MIILIGLKKSSSSSNPTPTPTPSINNSPVNHTFVSFNDSDAVIELNNTNLPNGVTGYLPINVNTSIDFNKTTLTENDKWYRLNKITPQSSPLIPNPKPYYQLEPSPNQDQQGWVPQAMDIAQVIVKATEPEIPTIEKIILPNSIVQGNDTSNMVLDLSVFIKYGDEQDSSIVNNEITINKNQAVITVDENTTNDTYIIRYAFIENDDSIIDENKTVTITQAENHVLHYARINVGENSVNVTNVPDVIAFGRVVVDNTLQSLLRLTDVNSTSGTLMLTISKEYLQFGFSDMDVDPNSN